MHITIPPRAFAHWNDGWQIDPALFTLHVGQDAAHTPHTTRIPQE